MSLYSQITWLPLCGGLTVLGLFGSWLAWRRRGAAAGLRGAAWSLLPLAAYLTGAVKMLWQMGSAIGTFAASFVFSTRVWSGVIVAGVAAVLFVASGGLRRRRGGRKPKTAVTGAAGAPGQALPAAGPAASAGSATKALKPARKKAADDDELGDVAEILRRHGIS